MNEMGRSFDLFGSLDAPLSPVVVSVPHAGRDYPLALRVALRVPLEALTVLEDRYVDVLAHAARAHETMLIQRPARAWIDLNRAETERDPQIDAGVPAAAYSVQSARLRSGLGLIPRRAGRAGDVLKGQLTNDEVMARIVADHRPYHAALSRVLAAAEARFGIAILLDVHSMPPPGDADIIFGDRFGRTAATRLIHRLEAEAQGASLRHALNVPYAGGHVLELHARPEHNIHAIQVEWSRALYLDSALNRPGARMTVVAQVLRNMLDALADEASALGGTALAAQ